MVTRCAQVRPWAIIGESAAGAAFSGAIQENQAVRIFTGGVVPEGADSVLIKKYTSKTSNSQAQSP